MNIKEAIERIKVRFDKWALDDEDMKAIQTLVPELKESEDERLRRLLVWQVHRNIEDETNDLARSVYDGIKGHDPDLEESIEDWKKCLAYLERQKEQKPKMIQWTGKNLKEVINFTGKSPRFDEWFKSWEDFENYVHSHGDILKLFCEDGSHYEVPVGAWIVKTPDSYNTPSRFRFIQKHAGWSEEDEEMLIGIVERGNSEIPKGECGLTPNQVAWLETCLKPLRSQPKQEWSEEDENKFDLLHTCICRCISDPYWEYSKREKVLKEIIPFIDRLKALRDNYKKCNSRWKPSEEQMKALKEAVDEHWEADGLHPLYTLYDDLQKQL